MRLPRTFCDYPSAYTSFEQIPDSKKLQNYEQQFIGEDVWKKYLCEQFDVENQSRRTIQRWKKAGRRWKDACNGKCHHACASPRIINEWSAQLLRKMSKESADRHYLSRINKFYRFLMWNINYPHSYNPVQFAVEKYEETRTIWNAREGQKYD